MGAGAAAAAALLWLAPGLAAVDAGRAQALGALKRNFEPLRDLSAEVTIETTLKGFLTETTYRQRYRYRFKRPSHVRIDYREPAGRPGDPRVKIARGRAVWVDGVRRETGEVDDAAPPSLLSLSLDPAAIERDFAVRSFLEPARRRLLGLTLTPHRPGISPLSIKLWVDVDRGIVEETKVFGADGVWLSTSAATKVERVQGMRIPVEVITLGCEGRCKTVVRLTEVAANTGLRDDLFAPAPPSE
jgi:outer membrane lipoprotein-sorting protein